MISFDDIRPGDVLLAGPRDIEIVACVSVATLWLSKWTTRGLHIVWLRLSGEEAGTTFETKPSGDWRVRDGRELLRGSLASEDGVT